MTNNAHIDPEPTKPGAPFNNFEELLALLTSINPVQIAGKTIELLVTTLQNTASAAHNLNLAASRVNTLLDDIEEPLRALMPQVGTAFQSLAQMGDIAKSLSEVTKCLGPLTSFAESAGAMFGVKPPQT